jgi:hypothetical protein
MPDQNLTDGLDGPAHIEEPAKPNAQRLFVIEVSVDGSDWTQLSLPFPITGEDLTFTIRGENAIKIRDGYRLMRVVEVYDSPGHDAPAS